MDLWLAQQTFAMPMTNTSFLFPTALRYRNRKNHKCPVSCGNRTMRYFALIYHGNSPWHSYHSESGCVVFCSWVCFHENGVSYADLSNRYLCKRVPNILLLHVSLEKTVNILPQNIRIVTHGKHTCQEFGEIFVAQKSISCELMGHTCG